VSGRTVDEVADTLRLVMPRASEIQVRARAEVIVAEETLRREQVWQEAKSRAARVRAEKSRKASERSTALIVRLRAEGRLPPARP
jgi:hypothetical protein